MVMTRVSGGPTRESLGRQEVYYFLERTLDVSQFSCVLAFLLLLDSL